MVPVQRTAKAWVVVSRGSTGFEKAQSKSISLSMRVMAGAPSKLGLGEVFALQALTG